MLMNKGPLVAWDIAPISKHRHSSALTILTIRFVTKISVVRNTNEMNSQSSVSKIRGGRDKRLDSEIAK